MAESTIKSTPFGMQTIASNNFKATSTNYEYVGVSFTIPADRTYLVWLAAGYASGAPVGIALTVSNSTPSSANTVCVFEWANNWTAGKTPVMMLTGGTYYMWVKRASTPSANNSHVAYGVILH